MDIKITIKRVFLAGLLTLPAAVFSADMRIAAELMHFDYEETDLSGNKLNQETGYIPGLSIAASRPYRRTTNTVEFSIYGGPVDYDGSTQAGQPHHTSTEQTILRLLYRLDWSPQDTEGAFYGKAYWQQWDRDIKPNNGVLGLFERYRWWSFEAGVQVPLFKQERSKLLLELGVLATSNGTIMIDLTDSGFGRNTLELGNGFGFSGELKYELLQSDNSSLQFGVQLKIWEFGRSNSKTVSNGNDVITITEPDSSTRQTILFASYIHRF